MLSDINGTQTARISWLLEAETEEKVGLLSASGGNSALILFELDFTLADKKIAAISEIEAIINGLFFIFTILLRFILL